MRPPKLLIAATLLAVAACQPAPEERFERAQAHFDEHEYRAVVIELKNALQDRAEYPAARFLLAQASYQLADFATAQSEAERALSLGMDEPEVWHVLGKALLAAGDAEGVLERVEPNLNVDTATPEQLVMLGDTFLALGNLEQATEHYRRALGLDAATPGALIGEAVIARMNGDAGRAEELLSEAAERNPGSALVWRARGNFLRAEGRDAAAAEAYERAITLETGATPLAEQLTARVNLVSTLLDVQDTAQASRHFEQLRQRFPRHPYVRYLHGRLAYAQGDYALAENELREYLAGVPEDLRGHALLGAVNFSQNHLRQAEIYLRQAVRNNVGGPAIARLLAETQLRLDKPGEALTALGGMEPGDSADPSLLSLYGRARLGLGDTAGALEYFERGAMIEDRNAAVSLSLAAGFFTAGEYRRAVELLEAIPETEDTRFRRETLMIAAHIQDGNRDAAVAVGDELLANNPDDPAAYATVGAMRRTLGDVEGARQALEQALELDPGNPSAGYALSRLEIGEGRPAVAERLLNQILDRSSAYMPALTGLAGLLAYDGRLSEIDARIAAAITADEAVLAPRLLRIRVDLFGEEPEAALAAVREARERFPEEPLLDHAEGLARLQQGQMEIALAKLRQAANADRENPAFQFDLARLALSSGDLSTAADAIERYRALRPDDASGLAAQVRVLLRQGSHERAREAVRTFASANPDANGTGILLGDIAMAAGDARAAAEAYEAAAERQWGRELAVRLAGAYQRARPAMATQPLERWLNENPDDAGVRRVYGQLLEAMGQQSAAVAEYEKLLASGLEDPIALNNLAWQYAQEGREEAVELAKKAYELAPDNGSIVDTYGWILFQNGNLDEALPLLERAAELSPNNHEIRFHLAAALAEAGNQERASAIIAMLLETDQAFPSRAAAEELARSL